MTSNSLVLVKRAGSHSNRLIQSLHFHAWCIHKNITFYNNDFADMAYLYNDPPDHTTVLLLLKKGYYHQAVYNFSRDKVNKNNPEILSRIFKGRNFVKVKGFYFRSDDLVFKYRELLISKYSLKNNFYVENYLTKKLAKSSGTILVGIHIRRGDYITFKDGKYYYEDSVYESWIQQLEIQILQKTHFILFSNENISIKENDRISHCTEKWFIDQYIMSRCDFLIGPPSTFTRWASFIGQVPLKHVELPNDNIRIEDFKTIKSP